MENTNNATEPAITRTASEHSPRKFLSDLLTTLPHPSDSSSNPLLSLANPSRNTLLTLHALFETSLLPALDLLDRHLLTRIRSDATTTLYLVRSTTQKHAFTNTYEVRLDAWNCSCPAFTFAAFPATSATDADDGKGASDGGGIYVMGGLTRGTDVPMCKHLLACVLAQHGGAFARFVEERHVSAEEMAGWAAGWGD